jgi:WD40 repeat protein/serine/threonine protein kinase
MQSGDEGGEGRLHRAREAYAAYVGRLERGEKKSFEDLCAEQPGAEEELRTLHSVFELGRSFAGSRSIREGLGVADEITVSLEGSSTDAGNAPAFTDSNARYELLGEVTRGGMGIIYRLRDRKLNRTIAMKVLLEPGGTEDHQRSTAQLLARFVEEAQITAQLDHPGIVPVHEAGVDAEGRPYFTMRLVKGRELGEVLRLAREEREGWNLARAVSQLVKACQAVAFAHARGVVHRDLKPSNIMVGGFGEVYVMDWGLAKVTGRKDIHDLRLRPDPRVSLTSIHSDPRSDTGGTSDSPLITLDGSVMGAPAFMAPEQAKGMVEEIDGTSDVYSLGAILYELLAGHAPYLEPGARLSPRTILAAVVHGPPRRLHEIVPGAPPEIVSICEKAMAREKDARYASSLDLAEDLQAFLDRRVVQAYRTGPAAELRSWVRRNKVAALSAAASLAALLLFSLLFALRERQNALELKHRLSRQYLQRAQSHCEAGKIVHGLHWLVRSLRECPPDDGGLRDVIHANLRSWSERSSVLAGVVEIDALRVEFGAAFRDSLSFSPDARRILVRDGDGTARLWSVETGEPLGPPLEHPSPVAAVAFSPDGARFATGCDDGSVRIWSADTGLIRGPMLHDAGVTRVRFSHDGARLVAATARDAIRLWSAETGEPVAEPMRHDGGLRDLALSPDGMRIITGHEDGLARVWSAGAGAAESQLVHEAAVHAVAFHPDGERLVTSSGGVVRFWSRAEGGTWRPDGAPMVHAASLAGILAFSPRGRLLMTVGNDLAARLWSAETGKSTGSAIEPGSVIGAAAFGLSGDRIFLAVTGMILEWSPGRAELPVQTFAHSQQVWVALFHPGGGAIVTAGANDRALRTWSIRNGTEMGAPLSVGEGLIWDAAYSPDGRLLLIGGMGGIASLWSLDAGAEIHRFESPGAVRAVAFSDDGELAATGSFDGGARVWSVKTGEKLLELAHPGIVEDIAFARGRTAVLTGCDDGKARLWSLGKKELVLPMMEMKGAILAVAVSPDERYIVAGGRDHTARFWHARTGQPTGRVLEHANWVEDVAFSPGGDRLLTGSADGAGRLWSVDTGEPLGPPLRHGAPVRAVAYGADGRHVLTAGEDGTAKLWAVPQAVSVRVDHAAAWVEALTGTRMDAAGVVGRLDVGEWRRLRRELEGIAEPTVQPAPDGAPPPSRLEGKRAR